MQTIQALLQAGGKGRLQALDVQPPVPMPLKPHNGDDAKGEKLACWRDVQHGGDLSCWSCRR